MTERRRLGLLAGVAVLVGLVGWAVVPNPAGEVVVEAPLRRIVSLSPALTEILFAIGAGDRVVGISDFTSYPPEALDRPSCGGQMNPNFEQLTRLAPDLVVYQGEHAKIREFCDAQGRRAWSHRLDTLADLLAILRELGELLDCEASASAVAGRLQHELAVVREAAAQRPRVRVLVCVGRPPDRLGGLTTCGPGSFLDELVTLAGGDNIFADATDRYPSPSLEAIVARAPEVILDLLPDRDDTPAVRAAVQAVWQPLASVPAVRHGRVQPVFGNDLLLPGPRVGGVTRRLLEALQAPAGG